jgi:hypothetical protein
MRKIEMITGMDWTKHGKQKLVKEITGVKRIPVTVSPELQKLINHFKASYPDADFSTTAVLNTLLEAGARAYAADLVAKRTAKSNPPPSHRDVPSDEPAEQPADHPDV